ncbi:hypothetical protein ACQP08_21675 [Micromonospora zamorensis]|uniref:hypothetical protein n=1 Tax=Micromonospora zamorensis TaxID=709883 RepID=UPI003D8A349F
MRSGHPEVIMAYRKPSDGSDLPDWKEALILRDYRRAGHTLADAASGIANLHNIILAG